MSRLSCRAVVLAFALTGFSLAALAAQPLANLKVPPGFLDGQKTLGRPADVQPLRDGSLLVSDDDNGVIYRITYETK
jgi:glucose/arabinose dehydrogenase